MRDMPISIAQLLSDDDDDRDAAQAALAKAGDGEKKKLLDPLRTALAERVGRDDSSWTHAARALLLLQTSQASAAVEALAAHADAKVRASLVSLFAELGPLPPAVVALARDEAPRVRNRVASKLAERPVAGAFEPLFLHATKEGAGADLLKAVAACSRLGSTADRAKVDALLGKLLDAKDDDQRENAISAFSYLRSATPASKAKLEKLATAKRAQSKWKAVGALAAIGDDTEARLALLIETASKGDSTAADSAGVVLAYDIDPDLVVPAYEKAMSHAKPVVRAFAVTEVTAHPDKRARVDIAKIEALLKDESAAVKRAAREAIASLAGA